MNGLLRSAALASASPAMVSVAGPEALGDTDGAGLAGLLRASVASSPALPESRALAASLAGVAAGEDSAPPLLVVGGVHPKHMSREGLGGEPVWLHIYDVAGATVQWVNSLARPVGTGAFHAGVEVFGQEWSFGYAAEGRTGVYSCRPRCNTQHKYRESVAMGVTVLTAEAVLEIVEALRCEWTGSSYDLLVRNCCHFSDLLCRKLDVAPAPEWLMNLAGAGATLVGGVDQAMATAHAARGLVAAIDEHYQITPAIETLLSRDFDLVDEDYVRDKARDLWAGAVDALAPVGTFAGGVLERASKAFTVAPADAGVWSLWTRAPGGVAAPVISAIARRGQDEDVRVIRVSSKAALDGSPATDLDARSSPPSSPVGAAISPTRGGALEAYAEAVDASLAL